MMFLNMLKTTWKRHWKDLRQNRESLKQTEQRTEENPIVFKQRLDIILYLASFFIF